MSGGGRRLGSPDAAGSWGAPAAALGALAYTVACPPYEASFAGWLVPGLLLVPCRGLRPCTAAACGVLFSLAMGFGVTGWAFHASLEYFGFDRGLAGAFSAAVWLVCGLPFAGVVVAYSGLAPRVPAAARAPLGAWLWAAMEVGRAALFPGLPWELLGHTQHRHLLLIQIADLGGVYAVSYVMAACSIAVAELIADRGSAASPAVRRLAPAGALLAATVAYGLHARVTYAGPLAGTRRTVAVVQGNVPNAFRWRRAFFERTLTTYARLTRAAATRPLDLVVWPENAVNFYLDREAVLRAQVGRVAALARDGLLVGGPRLAAEGAARNAAYLIDGDGTVRATYDKQRLVPFAEYNPLPWLTRRPPSGPVYTAGETGRPLEAGSLRLGAMICYEVLFPGLVRDLVRRGAEVLVNLSNDSWMDAGDGAAPRQHLSMAVFRAVETRRHLVRASANGTSAFVSPFGAVGAVVPARTAGAAVGEVTARTDLTPYVRWGEGWILLGAVLLAAERLRPGVRRRG